jgi:hypothetical protein
MIIDEQLRNVSWSESNLPVDIQENVSANAKVQADLW